MKNIRQIPSLRSRRDLIAAGGAFWLIRSVPALALVETAAPSSTDHNLPRAVDQHMSMRTAPIELIGNWGQMIPGAVQTVLALARTSALEEIRLLSDRQPARIKVDEHRSGPPSIWLHKDEPATAWVIVDIGERAWSQLAYQFGHELGHVLANSWQPDAKPGGPCQWLEEALVEAFSLSGLGRLAAHWTASPPFRGDNAYGDDLKTYRLDVELKYSTLARQQGGTSDFAAWFRRNRANAEAGGGLNAFARAAVGTFLSMYEEHRGCAEALGALNRWPGRANVPIEDYLRRWRASCSELGASTKLPRMIQAELGLA